MATVCLVGFPEIEEKDWISKLQGRFECVKEKSLFALVGNKNLDWIFIYVPSPDGTQGPLLLGFNTEGEHFLKPFELDAILSILKVKEAEEPKKAISKGKALDWELIRSFIDATKEVFGMMAGIEVQEKEVLEQKGGQNVYGDVSGIIGFTGLQEISGEIHGSVAVTLPIGLAQKIVANMLMLEPEEVQEEEMRDGVGELINMISGDAKGKYNDKFKISLPTVVTGQKHTIGGGTEIGRVVVKFTDPDNEEFYLQICLEEKNN